VAKNRDEDIANAATGWRLWLVRIFFFLGIVAAGILATTRTSLRCDRAADGSVDCTVGYVTGVGAWTFPFRTQTVTGVKSVTMFEEKPSARDTGTNYVERIRRLRFRGDNVVDYDRIGDLSAIRSFLDQPSRKRLVIDPPRDPRGPVAAVLLLGLAAAILVGTLIEAAVGRERMLAGFGFDAFGRDMKEDEEPKPWQRAAGFSLIAVIVALGWFFVGGGHQRFGPRAVQKVAALHEAAKSGDVAAVKAVLDRGVDPDAPDDQDRPPLIAAAIARSTPVVVTLLEGGANPDARDNDGRTALLVAASYGDVAMVRALVDAGADVNTEDGSGWSVLSRAAESGSGEKVRLLLEAGADAKRADSNGWTPLLHAAAASDEATRLLLDAGANPRARTPRGMTGWDLASMLPETRELFARLGIGPGAPQQ